MKTAIFYMAAGGALFAAILWVMDIKYMRPYDHGFATGYAAGAADALRPSLTNHRLEDVCVGMWVGNQIKDQK